MDKLHPTGLVRETMRGGMQWINNPQAEVETSLTGHMHCTVSRAL